MRERYKHWQCFFKQNKINTVIPNKFFYILFIKMVQIITIIFRIYLVRIALCEVDIRQNSS